MTFPFDALSLEQRELGLTVAVALGFAFGFVLERAGFGRADKLAAQFYLRDMTVFKVMFGAIVTAGAGAALAGGLGLLDLKALADAATSETRIAPMLVGGFALGIGFILAGYCPGTSVVAAASGNVDGLLTFAGVVLGTFLYSEALAWAPLAAFHEGGSLGQVYLHELVDVPAVVVTLGVALMALGLFIGAEKVEGLMRCAPGAGPARSARLTFALVGVPGLATLLLPASQPAVAAAPVLSPMVVEDLAERVVEAPWTLRIVDLRAREACVAARVPGSECVPAADLGALGLGADTSGRTLVLVGAAASDPPPVAVTAYPGPARVLVGGFSAWEAHALSEPTLPADADAAARRAHARRAALHAVLTGSPAAPPPPPPAPGAAPPRKKGGGGCN